MRTWISSDCGLPPPTHRRNFMGDSDLTLKKKRMLSLWNPEQTQRALFEDSKQKTPQTSTIALRLRQSVENIMSEVGEGTQNQSSDNNTEDSRVHHQCDHTRRLFGEDPNIAVVHWTSNTNQHK